MIRALKSPRTKHQRRKEDEQKLKEKTKVAKDTKVGINDVQISKNITNK